ncbi:hypothetical protein [Planococcus halotolerans]|uniref:Uncharacterized protein n=1 Tax=Planococcus halotolerans TaxID=2233542 RepID=A0A365KWW6_9BACL|nr:hypothetical protein [Planococcus halotolerans]QHJ69129.1 hypothetical protein DNR44_000060 [Planococcus halotolerans]RAZ77671.1 hypothetical protein DP120_09310 [Planococcus halotolerans]
MSKKMKVLICMAGFFIAAIVLSFSFFHSAETPLSNETETIVKETNADGVTKEIEPKLELTETEQLAKDYAEEKYGFEVDVIEDDVAKIYSSADVILSPKNDEDIRFGVLINHSDHSIIEDDYQFALEADKELQKLTPFLPAIEDLGFTGSDNTGIRLNYIEESTFLSLRSDKEVNFKNFIEEELDRYYELYQLIKKSQANLTSFSVSGSDEENGISLYLEPPSMVKTKEEFLTTLKINHLELVNHEIESQYATEVKNLNNERFNFGNHYDHTYDNPFDSWLHCTEINEVAECTSAVLAVTYQEDKLNSSNPHLNEDLTSIFKFIETHLEPEIKIEFVYIDGKAPSIENLEIGYEDRMAYENIDELIAFLLNE